MLTEKMWLVALVAGVVLLATGTAPGHALPARQELLSPETSEPNRRDVSAVLAPQNASAVAAAGGAPIGGSFVIHNESGWPEVSPTVAYNPDRQEYLVAFWNDRPGCDDIRAERVSRDGKLLGGVWVAAGCPAESRYPDVAYNSQHDEYLVVWVEEESANSYIKARRLSANAQPLGATLTIFGGGSPSVQTLASPAVAYASTVDRYLVVWQDELDLLPPNPDVSSIAGQIVSGTTGLPIGGTLAISQDPGGQYRAQPDVAYNRHANGFLVVWIQFPFDIYSCLVDGDGPPPSFTPQSIGLSPTSDDGPVVAAIPTAPGKYKFLVVWEDADTNNYWVYAHLVAENGTPHPGGEFPIVWDYYSGSTPVLNPTVAGDESGQRYLATWSQPSAPPSISSHINGRTVSPGGVTGQETYIGGVAADHSAMAAGPLGDFLVVFEDTALTSSAGIYGQLWGNRVYLPLVLRNTP